MKKITVLTMFILGTFFGCGLNAQAPVDELGIKNEKDFVKFIKSVAITENKVSESQYQSVYNKKIRNGNNEYTVSLVVDIVYGNDVYRGKIYENKKLNIDGFIKGDFKFMTHNDVIIGSIEYFTGPGPYRKPGYNMSQFVDTKNRQNYENMKSIPNGYETTYLLKGDFVFEPGQFSNYDYQESEDDTEERRLEIRKKRFDDSVNVVKENETERCIIVGVGDENSGDAGTFLFNIHATSFNQQELKSYKITSVVRIVRKKDYWVNNGSKDKLNYGYLVKFNPQKDNDTLVYKSWSPKLNGKIVDYKIIKDEKVQMRTGEYKDGLQIGELVEYTFSREGDFEKGKATKIIRTIKSNDLQGRPLKSTEYRNESFYLNGDNFYINYPYIINNYDPITRKENGLYQTYQLLKNKSVIDKNILSTPIMKETGNFLQGIRVGEWNEFFENGKLKTKINHTTGESETYDEQGKLLNKTFKKIQ